MNATRSFAALVVLFGLASCGDTGDTESASDPNDQNQSTNASPQAATEPRGAYWSWTTELTWVTSPLGYSYTINEFKYVFYAFGNNGYVYTGDPVADLGQVTCESGKSGCETFSIANGTITIGDDEPKPVKRSESGWRVGSDLLIAIPDYDGLVLDGTYASTSCYLASCSKMVITFTPDGRYELSKNNTYVNTIADTFVAATSSGANGGAYAIGGQHIDITNADGVRHRIFFFRDQDDTSDTIQLGDTWLTK